MAEPLVLGIDIGSTCIKAMLLQKVGKTYVARDMAIQPIPDIDPDSGIYSSSEEEWQPDWNKIADVLSEMVKKHSFKNLRTAFSLQGNLVAPRFFSFPQMEIENLSNAISFEAQESVPFSISDSLIDWELFPFDLSQNPPKMEGIFVAAHKGAVDTIYNLAYDVGVEPVVVDVDSLAVANAFLEVSDGMVEKNTLLLNIGNRITNLIVLTNEGRIFVRDIFGGGSDATQAIKSIYNMSVEESEELKTGGVFGEPNSQENILKLMENQQTLIEDGFYNLIMQIRDTLRYFISQRYISVLEEIHVTGGCAMLPGLIDFLGENLELPSIGWNVLFDISLQNIHASRKSTFVDTVGPMFAVATGLAMRADIK
ncbi:MAG: pilus assembly protein PilM [Planctomycetes bacterium]|nr:pilus assembly protein PilM [Planctomycetota bacterium]